MASAQEILAGLAAGRIPSYSNPPVTVVQQGPGSCGMVGGQGMPTQAGVQLNPNNVVAATTGYIQMCITNDNPTVERVVPLGGGFDGDAAVNYGNLIPFANAIIGTNIPGVRSCNNFYPAGGPLPAPPFPESGNAAAFQLLNKLILGGGFSSPQLTFQVVAGSVAELKTREVVVVSVNPFANFDDCVVRYEADPCSPCFNSDSNVVNYGGNFIASNRTMIFLPIPKAVDAETPSKVNIRICLSATSDNALFTPVGA